jgi:hypothetical protein
VRRRQASVTISPIEILDLWVGDEHTPMNQGDVPVTVLSCLTPPSF